MKTRQILAAVLAAAFTLAGSFPAFAAETAPVTGDDITNQESAGAPDENHTENAALSEPAAETDYPLPDEAPAFHARIAYQSGDYIVTGTFTDFTPDIIRIDTLYSLDGVNWQTATGGDWRLNHLTLSGTGDENELYTLQNQTCLLGYYEPLKSYRTGEIDHFYVKLHITKKKRAIL